MTGNEIRDLIKRVGIGETFTAKLQNVAERVGCTEQTLWNYLSKGVPHRLSVIARLLENIEEQPKQM